MTIETRRVLLVDGSDDEREMYAEYFRRGGFWTLQANNAADALRLASELPPAAIVTDVRLAGIEDGFLLARRLKQDERMRHVPVVVLSAYGSSQDADPAVHASCDLLMKKPCLPDVLCGTVADLIARRNG